MKIGSLKTKVIGPILLLLPMMCMHLGEDHHGGYHRSFQYRQSSSKELRVGMTTQGYIPVHQSDSDVS